MERKGGRDEGGGESLKRVRMKHREVETDEIIV